MSMAVARVEPTALDQALIKAVGLDRVPAEQRTLALHIAERYGLDLMLRHIVMVDGKPYITRDGLLHVAHRSGVFDGIEVTDPVEKDGYWHVRATVYRKDMSRGIAYPGRYPVKGKNATFAQEMGIKVAEVMALRRAFDVSAPSLEERWDLDDAPQASEPRPVQSLADRAAARRASIEARTTDAAGSMPAPAGEPSGGTTPADHAPEAGALPASGAPHEPDLLPAHTGEDDDSAPSSSPATAQCEAMSDPAMPPVEQCRLFEGHKGVHRAQGMSWPA